VPLVPASSNSVEEDDLESDWQILQPDWKRREPPIEASPDEVQKGRAWVGFFGHSGHELNYEGYARFPVDLAVDPGTNDLTFRLDLEEGALVGTITGIGVWETHSGDTLIHRWRDMRTTHVRKEDRFAATLAIHDVGHAYGGVINVLKMRGLL
jgi:hypothetical protein